MRDRDPLRTWLTLLSTSNSLKKHMDARMRARFGLSLSRFDVMSALDRSGAQGLNGRALSMRLKVTEGNTTQVTAPLIELGLVNRSVSNMDARMAVFKLTAKGKRLFERMAEANRDWTSSAFADLSSDQIAQLRTLLSAIQTTPTTAEEPAP